MKISCPRMYFLICTSVLSLPFIRLFIGFLKKHLQRLLHFVQASEYAAYKSLHCRLSSLFSLWYLVSHVFLSTHLYQPDPQHKHNTDQFWQGYWLLHNDLLPECPRLFVYAALDQFGFRFG